MGLAGRKDKQRIGADPRNLTWADDASKFGQAYLSKLGWDPSKGLGASGDGRTTHISVAQKLNLLGIGAGAKQGAEDIAWKQNRDYELVLQRLNAAQQQGNGEERIEETIEEALVDGFVRAETEKCKKKEKRKKEGGAECEMESESDDEDSRKKKKKRRREEKERTDEKTKSEKVSKKKRRKPEESGQPERTSFPPVAVEETVSVSTLTTETSMRAPKARPMAHRARFLASKRLALQDSAAMSQILGVASSSTSAATSGSSTPATASSSTPDLESAFASLTTSSILSGHMSPLRAEEQSKIGSETLTTSSISLADYFKEKLAARSKSSSAPASPSPLSQSNVGEEEESGTRVGLGSSNLGRVQGSEGTSMRGLGFGSSTKFFNLLGGIGSEFVSGNTPSPVAQGDPMGPEEETEDREAGKTKVENKEGKQRKRRKEKEGERGSTSVLPTDLVDGTAELAAGCRVANGGDADKQTIRKKKKDRTKEHNT